MTGLPCCDRPGHDLDGHLDDAGHHYNLRVQFEDTDAGGIVYHAKYLAFAERARSAWLRCVGIDQRSLLNGSDAGFVVRHIAIDFMEVAKLFAILEITTEVIKIGGASVNLQQTITNAQSCHIVARLLVDIGFVSLQKKENARARRMPKVLREKLSFGSEN